MINRALSRLKTLQILYAHYQNDSHKLEDSKKELLKSLDESYELYLHMLALLTDVRYFAECRTINQETRAQLLRIENLEKSSDSILAKNKFLLALESNPVIDKFKQHRRQLWELGDNILKRVTDIFTQSTVFEAYVAKEDYSYEADRELVRALYKQFLTDNDDLTSLLEDKSIYWNDDKDTIDSFILKTIKRYVPDAEPEQQIMPAYEEEEDSNFATQLLTACIKDEEELRELIARHMRGWDYSRVAMMDLLIMQMALAEITTFDNIPLNVSFSEYINMARFYSTPKSCTYVNGVLDAAVQELKADHKIFK